MKAATFLASVVAFVVAMYFLLYLRYTQIVAPIVPRAFVTRDTLLDPNILLIILLAGVCTGLVAWGVNALLRSFQRNAQWRRLNNAYTTILLCFLLVLPFTLWLGWLTWLSWPPQYVQQTIAGYEVFLVEKNDWGSMDLNVVVIRLSDQRVAEEELHSSQHFPLCAKMTVEQLGDMYTFACFPSSADEQLMPKTLSVKEPSLQLLSGLTTRLISTSLDQLEYYSFR